MFMYERESLGTRLQYCVWNNYIKVHIRNAVSYAFHTFGHWKKMLNNMQVLMNIHNRQSVPQTTRGQRSINCNSNHGTISIFNIHVWHTLLDNCTSTHSTFQLSFCYSVSAAQTVCEDCGSAISVSPSLTRLSNVSHRVCTANTAAVWDRKENMSTETCFILYIVCKCTYSV